MSIVPYKQSLGHSCLVACFLMVLKLQNNISFSEADEQRIALNGSKRIYPFYVVGVPMEIAKEYKKKICVVVDNRYFTKILQDAFLKEKNIRVLHKPITLGLIKNLLEKQPLICHIDDNILGDYSHASHFIVLEKATENTVFIVDPWSGERKRISNDTLVRAIRDLKTHMKMCPLIFSITA